MKNFRKVLALVLVVATLLSFATVASADYKDQADIAGEYEVAVDILTGLGILEGEKKGDDVIFRPTDEIDRDEVAKMVAVLANGGADIEAYYADACTFTDVKNTWAAGYVAYCYHTGIVDGRNATTFDPDASITGYEVAKMLLCLMGFDADEQGYVGKDWKVNVLRDARNFELLTGLSKDFNLKNNIKRQEVAQMMINAMNAPIVLGTLSDNVISISNALYLGLNVSLKDIQMGKYVVLYGNVVVIAAQNVGSMFGINTYDVFDCYGRPYQRWASSWNGWYKDYAYPATSKSTAGHDKLSAQITFIDGLRRESALTEFTGYKGQKGLIVETYTINSDTNDDGKKDVVAVILNTDLAQVTDTYKWQGAQKFDMNFVTANRYGVETTKLANTAGYAVGDMLLVTYCNGQKDVHGAHVTLATYAAKTYEAKANLELVKPEKVKVTDVESTEQRNPNLWSQANTVFFSGTTKYEYHYNNANKPDVMAQASIGKTYAVYRANGYVIAWGAWVDADTTPIEYAYFNAGKWYKIQDPVITASGVKYTYYVNDVIDFAAAETDEVKIELASANEIEYTYPEKGLLAQYKVVDGAVRIVAEAVLAEDQIVNVAKGEIDGIQYAHATDNTKFLVRVAGKYESFTGYKALAQKYPELLISGGNVQYFLKPGTYEVTYAFIDAKAATYTDNFFLLSWNKTRTSDQLPGGWLDTVEEFNVVVNGEPAKLWIDSDRFEGNEGYLALEAGLYNTKAMYLGVSLDGEPVYYVDDRCDVDANDELYTLDYIVGGKIFWIATADQLQYAHELADEYVIWGVNFDKDGKFVDVDTWTDAESFNDEWVNERGYTTPKYWVVMNAEGDVTEMFVVRNAQP